MAWMMDDCLTLNIIGGRTFGSSKGINLAIRGWETLRMSKGPIEITILLLPRQISPIDRVLSKQQTLNRGMASSSRMGERDSLQ